MKLDESNKEEFKNLKKLEYFLESEFIPNSIVMKKNKKTDNIFPIIYWNAINDLKLSEKENKQIIDYLTKQGIVIYEYSNKINQELENYDMFSNYQKAILSQPLNDEQVLEKCRIYTTTKDPLIREQLILHHLQLVPYIAWKYAKKYNASFEQLESFGYEGLIMAIDKFDINKNFKFDTYARSVIKGYIKTGIVKSELGYKKNEILEHLNICKNTIESKEGYKLEEYPEEIKKEIIDLMISKYHYPNNIASIQNLENLIGMYLLEDLDHFTFISTGEDYTSRQVIYHQLKEDLNDIMMYIKDPINRSIIQLIYGLNDQEPKNLIEIGKILGMEQRDISRRFAQTLRQLSIPAKRKKLDAYLNLSDTNQNLDSHIKKGK